MFSHLKESLDKQFATLKNIARVGDDHSIVTVAREEIPRLISTVEALLGEHRPNHDGQCSTCWYRPWWQFGRRRHRSSPCQVYLAIHLALLDDAEDRQASVPRHGRNPHPVSV